MRRLEGAVLVGWPWQTEAGRTRPSALTEWSRCCG